MASHPPTRSCPSEVVLLCEVREFIAAELELAAETVTAASRLREDLGVDSVALLALFDELSLRYSGAGDFKHIVAVARERGVQTVGELSALITDHLAGRSPAGEAER